MTNELQTVGAMHQCRAGEPYSTCVHCGALAEALNKPCPHFMRDAAQKLAAVASPTPQSDGAAPSAAETAADILERIAEEPPINGNNLATARVLMAAQALRDKSPTPQADSQPAPVNTRQIAECYGDCPTDPKTCANPCKFDGRAARAPADSVTAPAEPNKADPRKFQLQGIVFALARLACVPPIAPALEHQLERLAAFYFDNGDEKFAQKLVLLKRGAFANGRRSVLVPSAPTPPAQAADSVLEDAADPLQGAANWLVKAHSGLGTSTLAGKLSIGYNRAKRLHDAAIAARKQGANHDNA